ncbi:CTP synthase [Candidatus Sumerlaeota bacterium]|nr:CTP synthase [Candidatus Sumerlaeota bacterium]
MTKFIFITGGVVSSLGKGIAAASLGCLLETHGYRLSIMKLDPYLNVDPGTMNPFQHGEVYVTIDGAETDLDLGHYERFTHTQARQINNITSGQIYHSVISKERKGEYLGGTIQVIPHITDEIKSRILGLAESDNFDIVIVEIGGTVGDIESLPFLEAIRQLRYDLGRQNCLFGHVTLLPFIKAAGEMKSKPTQHSVRALLEIGIQADMLICRTERQFEKGVREKIALFCNVEENAVFNCMDRKEIYEVPIALHEQDMDLFVLDRLGLEQNRMHHKDLQKWINLVERIHSRSQKVTIGVAGKYLELQDAYKSIYESLRHGGFGNDVITDIKRVDTDELTEENVKDRLADVDGVLIPGGFGSRGVEGKILAAKYARENNVPFFGICLGLQCALIEFCRNVCGFEKAHSTEFNPNTPHPVVDLLATQRKVTSMGGTMRLGGYPCKLVDGTRARAIYGRDEIVERHRHRYEVNNKYVPKCEEHGLVFAGKSPDGALVEIIELPQHPWFIGVQFHPEFQSRPVEPHPLFKSFIAAAKRYAEAHRNNAEIKKEEAPGQTQA